ncbi:MAG: 8-oxo-dGTP diphosphatase MutT [Alphaproteobacteria bacterium]|nr:8-oxo-dGTP diphosphatase MutT [Alphaproteobacteria bacterium]
MKTVHVAAAALIAPDGKILLAQRPEGRSMAGLWEFPGGKIESGETPEQALIRELHEELGITVAPDALEAFTSITFEYPDFQLVMPLFLIRRWQGDITAREHKALVWVLPHEMHTYPMPPADMPLVEALCAAFQPTQ